MKSTLRLAACLLLAAPGVFGQADSQLDGNKTLFTVMAAMNAAGFNAGFDSTWNSPLRDDLRAEILKRNPPSLAEFRQFRQQQRFDDPAIEYRMYVGYALLAQGAPDFKLKMLRNELPPDVALFDDLTPSLEKFYKEAGIEELWRRSQPAYDAMLEYYHEPVLNMVQRMNGYLRVPSGSGFLGKTFQIVADPMGPPNQIQFHTFYDHYYVVVSPSAEPQVADIRRGYLHFLLDPLATNAANEFKPSRMLGEYVQGAQTLASDFKTDYLLLATRSLIRAIEARTTFSAAASRQAAVDQAMKEGFILTAHFFDQLAVYEKQEQAIRLYFPEMVKTIDLSKEEARLQKLEFATTATVRKAKPGVAPAAPVLSPLEQQLEHAEDLYTQRSLEEARAGYLEVAGKAAEKPLQARAYYGLARIAALSRNPELAEKLFHQVLELDPPAPEKAWSFVYLARLSEAAQQPEEAVGFYKQALEVNGISEAARKAAEQGLKKKELEK